MSYGVYNFNFEAFIGASQSVNPKNCYATIKAWDTIPTRECRPRDFEADAAGHVIVRTIK